jgi:hypothetical protein
LAGWAGFASVCVFTASVVGAAPVASEVAATAQTTVSFVCTGAVQSWTVPAGVTSALFEVYGARGGVPGTYSGTNNQGGRSLAIIAVTPGETLQINVGCQGTANSSGAPAGWNGGGAGPNGLSGGGASDVRRGGSALTDRIIVAGGGGGHSVGGGRGGQGSGGSGTDGLAGVGSGSGGGGQGGSATISGAGGDAGTGGQPGSPGMLGIGGDAGANANPASIGIAAGGGGGYFGGGGGGSGDEAGTVAGGGGGGGSGLCPEICVSADTGVSELDGVVNITFPYSPPASPLTATAPERISIRPSFTG